MAEEAHRYRIKNKTKISDVMEESKEPTSHPVDHTKSHSHVKAKVRSGIVHARSRGRVKAVIRSRNIDEEEEESEDDVFVQEQSSEQRSSSEVFDDIKMKKSYCEKDETTCEPAKSMSSYNPDVSMDECRAPITSVENSEQRSSKEIVNDIKSEIENDKVEIKNAPRNACNQNGDINEYDSKNTNTSNENLNQVLGSTHCDVSPTEKKIYNETSNQKNVSEAENGNELVRPTQFATGAVDTNVHKSDASSDGPQKNERIDSSNDTINADRVPLVKKKQSCITCDSLQDKKPHIVSTWDMMGQVLKFCSQHGKDPQISNENDYICLSGVHLQNKKGEWFVADGTEFHCSDESELRRKKPHFNNTDVDSGGEIAKKVRKNTRVKLGHRIACDWIPEASGASGKWKVFLIKLRGDEALHSNPKTNNASSVIEKGATVHSQVRITGLVTENTTEAGHQSSDESVTKTSTEIDQDSLKGHDNTEGTVIGQANDSNPNIISSKFKEFKGKVEQLRYRGKSSPSHKLNDISS